MKIRNEISTAPCPMCLSQETSLVVEEKPNGHNFYIECNHCCARGSNNFYETDDDSDYEEVLEVCKKSWGLYILSEYYGPKKKKKLRRLLDKFLK